MSESNGKLHTGEAAAGVAEYPDKRRVGRRRPSPADAHAAGQPDDRRPVGAPSLPAGRSRNGAQPRATSSRPTAKAGSGVKPAQAHMPAAAPDVRTRDKATAAPSDAAPDAAATCGGPDGFADGANGEAQDRSASDRQAEAALLNREEAVLSDNSFAVLFREAVGLENAISIRGTQLHLIRFREAAGKPSDPVEKTLLDMLALGRLRLGRVHASAEKAGSPEAARVYLSAANRLMGEICKTALTLAEYRKSSRRTRNRTGKRRKRMEHRTRKQR